MKRSESPRVPVKLEVGPGGWVQVVDAQGFVGALVRFHQRDDGRLRPCAVLLDNSAADDDLDVRRFRSFPLADVETAANFPEIATAIVARLDEETTLTIEGVTSSERYRSTTRRTRRRVGTLRVPAPDTRGRYPDSFYEQLAAHYTMLVGFQRDPAPARTIAENNDVPVTTVHRWIRETRRRGFLPAARAQGRPG